MASNKAVTVLAAALLVAAAAMMGGAAVASAQSCNMGKLAAACKPAFVGGSAPTKACCANLRSQEGCFCQYQKNPAYGSYISNPNTPKTITSCGLAIPNC